MTNDIDLIDLLLASDGTVLFSFNEQCVLLSIGFDEISPICFSLIF